MRKKIKFFSKKKYSNPFFKKNKNYSASGKGGKKLYYGAKNRKNISFWKKVVIFFITIFFICLLSSIFYLLFFYPYFFIKKVEINGLDNIDRGEVEEIINNQLSQKRCLVLSQENIFVLDKNEITRQLYEKYNLVSLNVNKELPDILRVEVGEKDPLIIWKTGERFFEVDDQGIIIRELSSNELNKISEQNLPIIHDKDNRDAKINSNVVSPKMAHFAINFKKMISDRSDIKISHFRVSEDLRNELRAVTDAGWEIYLLAEDNLDQQVEKLFLFLKNKKVEIGDNLEYVDLRFGDRIYYK